MNHAILYMIGVYRKHISSKFPSVCRFTPTCSEYGFQAFERYSFFKAFYLTLWRILRCNPFNRGGFDPLK